MCNSAQRPAHDPQDVLLPGRHVVIGEAQRDVTVGEGGLVATPVLDELLLGGVVFVYVLLDDEPALDKCVDLTDAFDHDAGLELQSGLP